MTSTSREALETWIDRKVCDSQGEKIGTVADFYVDAATDTPEWIAVHTGWFGAHTSFVPLAEAKTVDDEIQVPYNSQQVKDAPHADPDGELSQDEEAQLYSHYGLTYSGSVSSSGLPAGTTEPSGNATSDDAMTRSEEELRVSKTRQEAGRVRLRKYLVTEQQNVTVPVTHEEVRIEREPITDANVGDATRGEQLTESEHEVVLHKEQVVVDKQVVAKERVRLDTEQVVEDQNLSVDIRKEKIDVDGENVEER